MPVDDLVVDVLVEQQWCFPGILIENLNVIANGESNTMPSEVRAQLSAGTAIKEHQFSTAEFRYLCEVVGTKTVAIDGDRLVVRVDSKMYPIKLLTSTGQVKVISGDVSAEYGYPNEIEGCQVTHFRCTIDPRYVRADQEESEYNLICHRMSRMREVEKQVLDYNAAIEESLRKAIWDEVFGRSSSGSMTDSVSSGRTIQAYNWLPSVSTTYRPQSS